MRKQINHARRNATFDRSLMRKRGYEQIGSGAFSRVYVHPDAPDVVVKVGQREGAPHVRSRYRDAFPDFASWIRARTVGSKFFPKIYDVREEGEAFIVIMRRYYKPPYGTYYPVHGTASKLTGEWTSHKADNRFRRALEKLLSFGVEFDIHSANVMVDGSGLPILTDPVLWRKP
ncbi:hypothetical protein [Aquibium oceanicum]|uniref:Protein kinase domain-containing protein n=1 Tax=Aquibium oceanicum TaxID=1670800 RepID=A0A1L3SXW0_9HYPH|nr:hypothetical protein [Aquibium oceanicum]APH74152.1 hypothetical protein BSQ44_24345 [Aquibium oceanicum]